MRSLYPRSITSLDDKSLVGDTRSGISVTSHSPSVDTTVPVPTALSPSTVTTIAGENERRRARRTRRTGPKTVSENAVVGVELVADRSGCNIHTERAAARTMAWSSRASARVLQPELSAQASRRLPEPSRAPKDSDCIRPSCVTTMASSKSGHNVGITVTAIFALAKVSAVPVASEDRIHTTFVSAAGERNTAAADTTGKKGSVTTDVSWLLQRDMLTPGATLKSRSDGDAELHDKWAKFSAGSVGQRLSHDPSVVAGRESDRVSDTEDVKGRGGTAAPSAGRVSTINIKGDADGRASIGACFVTDCVDVGVAVDDDVAVGVAVRSCEVVLVDVIDFEDPTLSSSSSRSLCRVGD